MKVLADLIQFNLLEKAGKGDVKVTQLSVDILHGIDPADREQAMLEAALAPQLFKDIHDRFPDGIPSENAIRSYLIQQDFMDAAIAPAITAFMETYRSVQNIRENESHGPSTTAGADSSAVTQKRDPAITLQTTPSYVGRTLPNAPLVEEPAIRSRSLKPNEINMDIRGRHEVHIEGTLDYDGLLELEENLKALKLLIKPRPAGPTGAAGIAAPEKAEVPDDDDELLN